MMRDYFYLILTAVIAVIILLALPRKKDFRVTGDDLLDRINEKNHIVSIHRYKEMKAGKPGLRLVDLRDVDAFAEGHLPDAINLPPESLDPNAIHRFFRDKAPGWVLYADKTHEAEKYWMLFTQMGRENLYVLETGPMLDSTMISWDSESSRMILVDEIPRFTFLPDSVISF
jgi:rhodanese-related sulfurtransferase